jgi:hypothetical protein
MIELRFDQAIVALLDDRALALQLLDVVLHALQVRL